MLHVLNVESKTFFLILKVDHKITEHKLKYMSMEIEVKRFRRKSRKKYLVM